LTLEVSLHWESLPLMFDPVMIGSTSAQPFVHPNFLAADCAAFLGQVMRRNAVSLELALLGALPMFQGLEKKLLQNANIFSQCPFGVVVRKGPLEGVPNAVINGQCDRHNYSSLHRDIYADYYLGV
jgi:hypothetical protein